MAAALLAFFLAGGALPGHCGQPKPKSWLCYYGTTFGADFYSRFDLVVLDGGSPPPLERTSPGRPVLLGYLSVGEIAVGGPAWELAEGQPYLVRKNPDWDSWLVDIRSPAWDDLLLGHAVPAILAKGFDGLFLDTLDSSLSLEGGEAGAGYPGVREALVRLIRKMKERRPDVLIAVNRGLPILPEIAGVIDYVVVEGLYSSFGGDGAGYVRVDEGTRATLVKQVREGLAVNPGLPVLTIDYAAIDQVGLAGDAVAFSRKQGFVPYVGTRELDDVYYRALDD